METEDTGKLSRDSKPQVAARARIISKRISDRSRGRESENYDSRGIIIS